MPHIAIGDFDKTAHPNPMRFVGDEQYRRYEHSGGLTPYKVCVVDVRGFRFLFLPLHLLEKSKRRQVLAALQRALVAYRVQAGAIT